MDWFGKLLSLPDCFLSTGGGTVGTAGCCLANAWHAGRPLPPSLWLTHAQPTNCLLKTRHPMQGVIQSTASEATLVALLAAKARAVQGRPAEDAHKVVAYCSDQAHSSGERVGEGDAGGWWLLRQAALDGVPCRTPIAVIPLKALPPPRHPPPPATHHLCPRPAVKKATMVAGVHHLRVLPTHAKDGYTLQPDALEAAIQADLAAGLLPCFVVATIGTTGSCAVDPVPEVAAVAQRHGLWCVQCCGAGAVHVHPGKHVGKCARLGRGCWARFTVLTPQHHAACFAGCTWTLRGRAPAACCRKCSTTLRGWTRWVGDLVEAGRAAWRGWWRHAASAR